MFSPKQSCIIEWHIRKLANKWKLPPLCLLTHILSDWQRKRSETVPSVRQKRKLGQMSATHRKYFQRLSCVLKRPAKQRQRVHGNMGGVWEYTCASNRYAPKQYNLCDAHKHKHIERGEVKFRCKKNSVSCVLSLPVCVCVCACVCGWVCGCIFNIMVKLYNNVRAVICCQAIKWGNFFRHS